MQLPGERAWPDSRRVGRNLRTTADAPEWSASSRPRDVGGRSNGPPSVSTRGVDSGWGGESLGDQEHEPNHHNATDKQAPPKKLLECLRVHSPRFAAFVVIPAEAVIQRNGLDSVSSKA